MCWCIFLLNFENNFSLLLRYYSQKHMTPYLGKKLGGWKWSLGRRRGGREQPHISLCAFLTLPFLWAWTYKWKSWGKKNWALGSSLRPVGSFPQPSGGFRELTSQLHNLPVLPLCKKLDFSHRHQRNDFQHIFQSQNEREKTEGLMKVCS